MKTNRKNAGFTLIELMIVVAIIAIIASIAIPKLMSARISANENAAIATLRSIAAAQQQFESSVAVDTDADGGGEFGFFGELAGTAPLRVYDPVADAPAIGAQTLNPPILPTAMGDVQGDVAGPDGVIERQGYFFKMFLPTATVGGVVGAQPEDPGAGVGGATAGSEPDPDNCEILWTCYAWPVEVTRTGNRAFMINQEGDVVQCLLPNAAPQYNGATIAGSVIPAFDAAFDNATGGVDMGAELGITAMGNTANDGNIWTVVGN